MNHASQIDIAEMRRRLPMATVCARDGAVKFKKAGTWLVGLCPFHEERKPSFQIGNQRPDRATCRGCGWSGDIIDYWMHRHGLEKGEAIRQLASLAGLTSLIPGVVWKEPSAKVVTFVSRKTNKVGKKPALPRMRPLKEGEIEALAKLRGLSVEGVRVAAQTYRRVGFSTWPLWQHWREGWWGSPCGAEPVQEHWWRCGCQRPECAKIPAFDCWVVTDDTRHVAQFRKLNGEMFVPKKEDADPMKAWTEGSPSWPLGAAELGQRRSVLFVEGGADMLAGFHFLHGFGMLHEVGVVCMLGGSNRIAEEALPYFKGTRVRIIMDEDPVKERPIKGKDGAVVRTKRTRAGADAAARWSDQLTNAGASVVVFSLEGLTTAAGAVVKDLNDLALCSADVVADEGIQQAFCYWNWQK